MGDMKCNEDTINPSYIEKKIIKEDQNMIQPTEKKERKDLIKMDKQYTRYCIGILARMTKNSKNNIKIRIYLLDTLIKLVLILNIIK